MIRMNVFIRCEESKRSEVLKTAHELVEKSLHDAGCIAYDIFESATRKNVFIICETWSDEKTLDAHMKTPHFTTLVPRLEALAEMKLEQFSF